MALAANTSSRPSGAGTTVPEKVVIWLKPHEATPPTVATVAERNTAIAA